MSLTIGELKRIIKDLDDNMKVGGSGHFGEYLKCYGVTIKEVTKGSWLTSIEKETILSISIEDAGDEPD